MVGKTKFIWRNKINILMKKIILYIMVLFLSKVMAQTSLSSSEKEREETSRKETFLANKLLQKKEVISAEKSYRKALSESGKNVVASFNLGDLLYQNHHTDEADYYFKYAGLHKNATKEQKHKAFHNLGNLYMKQKKYDQAVEAYKQALRNVATDEQTRYNLAVAQQMLKENPPSPPQKNKENKKDDKKDKNQQNQNQQNQNKNNQDNKQNQDKNNKGNSNEKENKNTDNQKNKNNEKGNSSNENSNPTNAKNKPEPNKEDLSPQAAENILKAMENMEKKTQEKINAQKVKAQRVKSGKDW